MEIRGLDTLLAERLAVLEPRVEEALIGRDRLVEIGDRDAEMMDPPHPRDATRVLKLVAHRQCAYRADRLGRMRVRHDVGEKRLELVAIERLLLEDIAPESRSSETIGTIRALPMRD